MIPADQGVQQGEDKERTLSFADLLGILRKSWWLLLLVAATGATGAAFYSHGQTKIYQATTTIQIDPTPPKPLGHDVEGAVDIGTTVFGNSQYYETQYEVLRSRSLSLQTVQRLGLHRDVTFVQNIPPGSELSDYDANPTLEQAAAALRSRLRVRPVKGSRLVELAFEDADSERAKRILRALVDIYIDNNIDSALESTSVAAEWLDEQLSKLKQELTQSELALHSYKREQQILSVSLDDQSNILRGEMIELSSALTRIRTELEALRSRHDQLADVDVDDPTGLPSRELLTSSVLSELRAGYIAAKQTVEGLLGSGKGHKHPDVIAATSNLQVHREALSREVSNIREALAREVRAKEAEEAGLTKLLRAAKGRALELNRLALKYRRLERTKENTEKVYSLVLERSKESDLTRHMRFNNIRLVDEVFASALPVRPRHPINIALGGAAGLVLGLTIAFFRHWLDRTFRTAEDVEEKLGLPLLGVLPRSSSAIGGRAKRRRKYNGSLGNELVVHEEPSSSAAEAARALRTNLMFSSPDTPQRIIVVTSGAPLEGKTTVACWVAIALAQTGQRVLLLDCDLRRPRIHKVYGRPNDVGVSSLVVDRTLLDQLDLATQVPYLDALPAGPRVPNPAELLQSDRFEELLDQLKKRYDRIVIDTPPIHAVTDAAVLSAKADGTMLVVRAHKTPYDAARSSVRALEDVSTNILGVVLNAFDQKRAGYAYGHGSYRYHGYYGSRDDTVNL